MSTVSEKIARNIISNDGVYVSENGERDPQCFAVFKIKNQYFGHIHFVVAYTFDQYASYAIDHEVVELCWTKDKPRIDAFNAELAGEL